MPRKQRTWFPGAIYHITCRGNRKTPIFHEREDYLYYLYLLRKTNKRHPFNLHAYCLMPNHTHLLLETTVSPPGEAMGYLNTQYAKYINRKYDQVGHVFQGRYGASLIDSMMYLIDVSRYIHQNPVAAKMVCNAEDYEWTSYRHYISVGIDQGVKVKTDYILSQFPSPKQDNYKSFIEGAEYGEIVRRTPVL
ncbi:REP element-mobilizing transposase RayT [Bacillus sp. OV194]|nr:REP element-mobilizing transposase RayT [Bacillus sp. OV194]